MGNVLGYRKCAGIYIFTNKISHKVYVGETLNMARRMKRYKSPENNRPFERALLKYGLDGFHIDINYLPNFKKDDLLDLEDLLIKKFKCLAIEHGYNIASRGKNTSGHKLSEETKLRMSQCKTGIKNPNYGKPLSEETKAKMSIAFSGKNNPNFGKCISDEQKTQISISNSGRKHSLETRERIKRSRTGRTMSEETKTKISEANKGRKRSPETREKMRKPKVRKLKIIENKV
jgi:group I intron endonuclease